MYLVRYG